MTHGSQIDDDEDSSASRPANAGRNRTGSDQAEQKGRIG